VAQEIAQLAQFARGDVGLRQQAGAQQLGRVLASTASFFTRAEAIALVRNGCARCSS
jgi:hypothetical protein